MIIKVAGCKDHKLRKEIRRAAHFFSQALLSHQMLPYVEVEIVVSPSMADFGSCVATHYNKWYKARYFEIELRKSRSIRTIITTLAHEMVHMKQFAKGELAIDTDRWHKDYIDTDKVPYTELPWEKEARSMERTLYKAYVKQFGKPSLT